MNDLLEKILEYWQSALSFIEGVFGEDIANQINAETLGSVFNNIPQIVVDGVLFILALLASIIVITVSVWIGKRLQRKTIKAIEGRPNLKAALSDGVKLGFGKAILWVVILIGVSVAAWFFGSDLTSVSGALVGGGAILAFGGAILVANGLAGIILLFHNDFALGDYVEIIGKSGQVKKIGIFFTTLVHPRSKKKYSIPNITVFNSVVSSVMEVYEVPQLDDAGDPVVIDGDPVMIEVCTIERDEHVFSAHAKYDIEKFIYAMEAHLMDYLSAQNVLKVTVAYHAGNNAKHDCQVIATFDVPDRVNPIGPGTLDRQISFGVAAFHAGNAGVPIVEAGFDAGDPAVVRYQLVDAK